MNTIRCTYPHITKNSGSVPTWLQRSAPMSVLAAALDPLVCHNCSAQPYLILHIIIILIYHVCMYKGRLGLRWVYFDCESTTKNGIIIKNDKNCMLILLPFFLYYIIDSLLAKTNLDISKCEILLKKVILV